MPERSPGGRRPRVLFVGRTRYAMPLPPWLAKKFDALERQLDYRVLASAHSAADAGSRGRFHLLAPFSIRVLDGVAFYLRTPFAVRRQIADFAPDVIVAESPYTGAASLLGRALAWGPLPRVVVVGHGDWRSATRVYGSPGRRALSPLADWVSRSVVRRGDAVRALSRYTESLVEEVRGVPVTASFPTYSDLTVFTERPLAPLPGRPTAVFVGMLEPYKNVDGLAAAWRLVVERLPEARLVVIGKGTLRPVVEELVAELPESVEWHPELPPTAVASKLDEGTVLVLPSRSEGLGRVVIEAFARGRGVVASAVGGIRDLVRDGEEGLLVSPDDVEGIAAALVRVLSDRQLAARLGEAARRRYSEWHTTPAEYAARVRGLVEASLRDSGVVPGERPRVLVVGRRSFAPTDPAITALREELDYLALGRAESPAEARSPAIGPGSIINLRSRLYRVLLPLRVARLVRKFRPQVIVAESPHLGFLVLLALLLPWGRRPALIIEVHEDWRSSARLGGSRLRLLLAPLADWAARFALRRADALRAASPFTAQLAERAAGVPLVESFPGYIDLHAFLERPVQPLPETPCALFVGMLERSKDLHSLVAAWRILAQRLPEARLVVVGRGALVDLVERLCDDFPDTVEHLPQLSPSEVARRMDEASLLVLPSRSEGLGRVIIESFTRGRPVVATRVGGIPDLVRDGVNGLLVPEGDAEALAQAMLALMTDRRLAERLASGALEAAAALRWTPDDYATRVRGLVDRALTASTRE